MENKVNLNEKLAQFAVHWSPHTIGQYNGNDLMVAKLKGEFHWHKHDDTDDFFMVISGTLRILLRDDAGEREVILEPGEIYVVPRGLEHKPVADEEVHILLIEPTGTPNTGDPSTAAPRRVI
ncbi:MAG: cupin domain-containing protein [Chloroflexi bacterium]|nr:cupin domain-containing protein [Chloroflexota bacterium]